MVTQDQNSGAPEAQKDPELENMDKLTGDVEKSLGSDIKRILQDKKQQAKQGKKLKKADIDFEVDTVTPTSKTNPAMDKDIKGGGGSTSSPKSQSDEPISEPTEEATPTKKLSSQTYKAAPTQAKPQTDEGGGPAEDNGDFPTVDSDAPPIYDFPQDESEEGGDREVAEGAEDAGGEEASAGDEGAVGAEDTEGEEANDSAAGQDGQQPDVTPDGAATGDNPLDATKQGRGATATGENPPGGDAGDMGDKSVIDAHNEDKLAEKPDLRDEKTKQLEKAHLNELKPGDKPDANKYKSPGTSSPSDLAQGMAGGENTPRPNAMEGGKPFQPGGGQVPPPEGEPEKPAGQEPEGEGGAMQKAGDMAKGAMDKGRQAADAVKAEVDAVKRAAQNVKDKLGAPGRKLAEAKEAINKFMDDMNPIKKLQKLFKSVSVPQLVGGAVRVYLMTQGMASFVKTLDDLIKEENANRLYTCCCCSTVCCACLFPFFPLIIAIIAVAAM